MNTALNLVASALGTLVVAAAAGLTPQQAHAAIDPTAGVRCPAGFEAHFSEGNRRMTCSRDRTYTLQSICIGAMDPRGSDTCLPVGTGRVTPSLMSPPLPGYPALNQFRRVVVDNGPDRFVATGKEWVYPVGGLPMVGNASRGVACHPDARGEQHNGGLRCVRVADPVPADCDFPWSVLRDQSGPRDRCTLANQTGPTKPRGMTKIQFDVDNALPAVRWSLQARPGTDQWQRRLYSFPQHP